MYKVMAYDMEKEEWKEVSGKMEWEDALKFARNISLENGTHNIELCEYDEEDDDIMDRILLEEVEYYLKKI